MIEKPIIITIINDKTPKTLLKILIYLAISRIKKKQESFLKLFQLWSLAFSNQQRLLKWYK